MFSIHATLKSKVIKSLIKNEKSKGSSKRKDK